MSKRIKIRGFKPKETKIIIKTTCATNTDEFRKAVYDIEEVLNKNKILNGYKIVRRT